MAVGGLIGLLVMALVGPTAVAAATFGTTLETPTPSTVQYSDLVTFRGTYTCVSDATSNCPTTAQSRSATFSLRPSGGSTFTTVTSVTTSFFFGPNPTPFTATWRSGKVGTSTTIPPGVYDIGLTTTNAPGQLVSFDGLTITSEGTTTTYGGQVSGLGGTPFVLSATVRDHDLGQASGTGIILPDPNLAGAGLVTFELYDSTNTNPVGVPVTTADLTNFGVTPNLPAPTLTPPSSGGSFWIRTTFLGNGFYTTSNHADPITVTPSNTPPQLVLPTSPIVAEATSARGAPVAFSVGATDAEDEPDPTPTCDATSGDTFPLGDTTVSCTVTDTGLLSTPGSFVVRVLDTTDPTAEVWTPEDAGAGGWYNAASNDADPGVTVDVSGSDLVGVTSLSCSDTDPIWSVAAPSGSFVVADGRHELECTAADAAGNHASKALSLDVDQTPPLISGTAAPPTAPTGWWNASTGAPLVSFVCSDATSGVASCNADVPVGEGASQSVTGTAADVAGNTANAIVSGLNVDLTAPTGIAFVGGGLADGGEYPYLFVPTGPTSCAASDAVSGLVTCVVTGYSTSVGTQVLIATATDVAGNVSTATLTYEVVAWTLIGFSKPIEMTGFNLLKAGNSAQLKFEVVAGSTKLTSVEVVSAVDQVQVSCDAAPGGSSPPPKRKTTPNVDAAGGHLAVRWDSPSLPGTCWVVTVRTADGSSLSAAFKLR